MSSKVMGSKVVNSKVQGPMFKVQDLSSRIYVLGSKF